MKWFCFKMCEKVPWFTVDVWLKLKIVPDSWEYTGVWKFGPYWPQK